MLGLLLEATGVVQCLLWVPSHVLLVLAALETAVIVVVVAMIHCLEVLVKFTVLCHFSDICSENVLLGVLMQVSLRGWLRCCSWVLLHVGEEHLCIVLLRLVGKHEALLLPLHLLFKHNVVNRAFKTFVAIDP